MGLNHTNYHQHRAKRPPDMGLQFPNEFILGQFCLSNEGAGAKREPTGRNIKNCSKSRSPLIDSREALLINRYFRL